MQSIFIRNTNLLFVVPIQLAVFLGSTLNKFD